MEARCESNRRGDEVYSATFSNEKTGLKLGGDGVVMIKSLEQSSRSNLNPKSSKQLKQS